MFDRFPPKSISAWVTVWLQVYVQLSVSCSLLSVLRSPDTYTGAALQFGSVTVIPVSVMLPTFVTTKL